jgi:hypothetical protein
MLPKTNFPNSGRLAGVDTAGVLAELGLGRPECNAMSSGGAKFYNLGIPVF